MQVLKIKVSPGQELMETLRNELSALRVRNGAIVSLIGALDSCCISNMPLTDAREDILSEYAEPVELTGTGEISDGKPHIHCVISRQGDVALAGHLHWGRVETWFVHVYIVITDAAT